MRIIFLTFRYRVPLKRKTRSYLNCRRSVTRFTTITYSSCLFSASNSRVKYFSSILKRVTVASLHCNSSLGDYTHIHSIITKSAFIADCADGGKGNFRYVTEAISHQNVYMSDNFSCQTFRPSPQWRVADFSVLGYRLGSVDVYMREWTRPSLFQEIACRCSMLSH